MKKIIGLVLFALFLIVPGVKAQSASANFSAVPLPAAPVVTKLVPASSYVTAAGFSQDGKTFVTSEKIQIIGTGFVSGTSVSFNGSSVSAVFVSATEVDITITQAMVPVPTVPTQYAVAVANPAPPVLN